MVHFYCIKVLYRSQDLLSVGLRCFVRVRMLSKKSYQLWQVDDFFLCAESKILWDLMAVFLIDQKVKKEGVPNFV